MLNNLYFNKCLCSSVVERGLHKAEVAGSIPATGTTEEIASLKGSPRGVYPPFRRTRRPNRTDFSGQKEIPDSVRSRKEKF